MVSRYDVLDRLTSMLPCCLPGARPIVLQLALIPCLAQDRYPAWLPSNNLVVEWGLLPFRALLRPTVLLLGPSSFPFPLPAHTIPLSPLDSIMSEPRGRSGRSVRDTIAGAYAGST